MVNVILYFYHLMFKPFLLLTVDQYLPSKGKAQQKHSNAINFTITTFFKLLFTPYVVEGLPRYRNQY